MPRRPLSRHTCNTKPFQSHLKMQLAKTKLSEPLQGANTPSYWTAASSRFEIWGVVDLGLKKSIFPGKFPKHFDFFRAQCWPMKRAVMVNWVVCVSRFWTMDTAVTILNSSTFSRLFFSAWPGSGAPLSRDLEGALYKFWLIDWSCMIIIARLKLPTQCVQASPVPDRLVFHTTCTEVHWLRLPGQSRQVSLYYCHPDF